jgi:hypothetical protein
MYSAAAAVAGCCRKWKVGCLGSSSRYALASDRMAAGSASVLAARSVTSRSRPAPALPL